MFANFKRASLLINGAQTGFIRYGFDQIVWFSPDELECGIFANFASQRQCSDLQWRSSILQNDTQKNDIKQNALQKNEW